MILVFQEFVMEGVRFIFLLLDWTWDYYYCSCSSNSAIQILPLTQSHFLSHWFKLSSCFMSQLIKISDVFEYFLFSSAKLYVNDNRYTDCLKTIPSRPWSYIIRSISIYGLATEIVVVWQLSVTIPPANVFYLCEADLFFLCAGLGPTALRFSVSKSFNPVSHHHHRYGLVWSTRIKLSSIS